MSLALNQPIVKQKKTNQEVIIELVNLVFEAISKETGANILMLRPALNIGKLKLSQMTEEEARTLVMHVHKISSVIERETGELSPYHSLDDIDAVI